MSFSVKQIQALRRNLSSSHVRTKEQNGRELSYVAAWHTIAEANRIFGFDGWDRETIESRCVIGREVRGAFHAVYLAKVRITVRAGGQSIVREGHGTGEGRGASAGETHDIALKAAETDGTRRALATFGRPFGLALYLQDPRSAGGSRGVQAPSPAAANANEPLTNGGLPESEQPLPDPVLNGVEAPSTAAPAPEGPAQCGPELLRPLGTFPRIPEIGTPRRVRDRGHLKFVTNQPCLLCARCPSDAHHLRFAQPRALGMKVSDEYVVPLCRLHHRDAHNAGNEVAYWSDLEIDVMAIAKGLWDETLQRRQGRAPTQRQDPSAKPAAEGNGVNR